MTSGCVENKGWNKKSFEIEESVRKLFIKTSSGCILYIKILRVTVSRSIHMTISSALPQQVLLYCGTICIRDE
jgi:hypothetical protein